MFRVLNYTPAAETLFKVGFVVVSDGRWTIDVYSARPELPEDREGTLKLAQAIADQLNSKIN
ncbi:unnamed protein product [Gemmataceae bacterium]|nr:unnamed protein product [Gemmataceae bacterium]VTU02788.1 unnamed protein product [Gemmataceae bacterium]